MGVPGPVVFSHTVKAFLDHLCANPRAPVFLARVRQLGIDTERPTDVPVQTWWELIATAAEVLFPELPREQGIEQVGRAALQGFGESFVGRTAFMVLKLLGPQRGLLRIAEQFRLSGTLSDVESRALGPHEVELHFTGVEPLQCPTYLHGLLTEGARRIGVKDASVTVKVVDDFNVLVNVSW